MIPQIECREQKLEIACLNAHLNIKTLHRLVFPHITFLLPSLWSMEEEQTPLVQVSPVAQFPVYVP